jgi:RNA recognition motif-containing protein
MPPKAAAKAPAAKSAPKAAAKPAEKKPEAAKPKASSATSASNGVHVKNWGKDGVDAAKTLFAGCGNVVDVKLRRGKYCLVWFDNSAAVKKAVDSFNGKELKGRQLSVAPAKSAPQADAHQNSTVVFAQPIFREATTRKQIFKLFSGAGKIAKLRTYRNNCAYVYFDSAAAAAKAIKDLNGTQFAGKPLTVKASTRSIEADKAREENRKLRIAVHAWKKTQKA